MIVLKIRKCVQQNVNHHIKKESSFRPAAVLRPVRAPESAGSFMADRCLCACRGVFVWRLPRFLVAPSPTHRLQGMTIFKIGEEKYRNASLQKESSFRPAAVRRPVRAPESAGSFMTTVVFVHAVGFSFGDFPDSLSRLAQRTGCKE